MKTLEAARRSGVGVRPDTPIRDAAQIMERAGVGSLAVIDEDRLVGIVTDRDLVRRAMAQNLPLDARTDAVMSTPVISIEADSDIHEAFALFRRHYVRRLAVVRGDRFVGMVTVDDLLVEIASDLFYLTRPVSAEVLSPQHDDPVPAPL